MPASESWVHAGKAYNMKLLCDNILNEIFPICSPYLIENEEVAVNATSATEKIKCVNGVATEWQAAWKESVISKTCWYKKLHEFYQSNKEIGWNSDKNYDEILLSAVEHYESNATQLWSTLEIKK